jgi:hypothetical protein
MAGSTQPRTKLCYKVGILLLIQSYYRMMAKFYGPAPNISLVLAST